MSKNLSLLYEKSVKIIYPVIGISGAEDKEFQNAPFIGLGIVEFQKGTVWITTNGNEEREEDVDITIYEGIPTRAELPLGKIFVSGFIEVENNSIMIAAGANKEGELHWRKGLTAVLVAIDENQVVGKSIKSVSFYLQFFKKSNIFSIMPR